MCRTDGEDYWNLCETKVRKARKPWTCGECGRSIEIGERYENVTGLWEGEWVTERTCLRCVEARRWLVKFCDGFIFCEVFSDLREHIEGGEENYMHTSELAAVVEMMHQSWCLADGEDIPLAEVTAAVNAAISATDAMVPS